MSTQVITSWFLTPGGLPDNDSFIPFPDDPLAGEIPKMRWRIMPGVNNGLPYHELLPGIQGIDLWALDRENVIRVYSMSEQQTSFDHNGLAILEPLSCTSVHNDERWDIELVHPLDEWGKWKYLLAGNILKISGQLFRIYSQEAAINSGSMTMTVHARHISCDMADMLITFATFPGGNASDFIDFCFTNIEKADLPGYEYYKFEGYSDIQTELGSSELTNTTLWAAMIGADNCLKNRYGGELYRDNFYFSINQRMQYAKDNAFSLRFSPGMTGISQKVDYSRFCTNLLCWDNFGNMWGISTIKPDAFVHHPIVKMAQFNYQDFDGAMERLMADGFAYWKTVNTPEVTYEVQFAALGRDPQYEGFADLQNYNYGDSGTIYCPELDISTEQRITEIEKNEITGDITRMLLGNLRDSLVRPAFMGSTISSGRSMEDKQLKAMQEELKQTKLHMFSTWGGAASFKWKDAEIYTWEEIAEYGNTDN